MKILIILLFASGMIFAQYYERSSMEDRRFGIGAQASYFNSADADNGGIMFGLVARGKFAEYFGAELSVNYRAEEYNDGYVEVTSWPVLLSALVYPTDFLYGLVGVGLYSTTFDYPDFMIGGISIEDETTSEFGFHLGGGLTFPVLDGFRMFTDVRYHILKYDIERVETVRVSESQNANFMSINVGFMFQF